MGDSFRIDPNQYRDVLIAASAAVSDDAHRKRAGISEEDAARLADLFRITDEEIEIIIAGDQETVEEALRILVSSDYYQQSEKVRDRVKKYQGDGATALLRSVRVHAGKSPAGSSDVPEIGGEDAKYQAQEIKNRAVEVLGRLPEEAVSFALEDVLSVTPGLSGHHGGESRLIQLARLLSGNLKLTITDMPRESDALAQMVLAQYPELGGVSPLEGGGDEGAVSGWIEEQKTKFGKELFFVPNAMAEGAGVIHPQDEPLDAAKPAKKKGLFAKLFGEVPRVDEGEKAAVTPAATPAADHDEAATAPEPVDTSADIARARELGESFKSSSREKHEDILRELGMLMTYGEPGVRVMATRAVSDNFENIRKDLRGNVVDHLILRLDDKEWFVRGMAAYELGKCLKLIKDFEHADKYLANAVKSLIAKVLHDLTARASYGESKIMRSATVRALRDNFDLIPEGMRENVAGVLKTHYKTGEFRNRVIDQLDRMPAEAVAFDVLTIKALLSDDSKEHVKSVYQLATHLLSVGKWNPSAEGQSIKAVRTILFDQYPSVDWERLKGLGFFQLLVADEFYLLPKSFVASFDAKQAAALAGKTSGAVRKPTEEGFFGRRGGVGTDEGLAELRAAAAELVAPLRVEGRATRVEGKRSLVTLRRSSGQASHGSLVGGGRGQRVAGSLSIVDGRRSIAQNPPSLRAKRPPKYVAGPPLAESNPDASTVSPRPSTSLGARDDRQAVAKAIEVARRSEGLSDVAAYLEALDDRRRQSLHSRATQDSQPLNHVYLKLISAGEADLVKALRRMGGELTLEHRILLVAAADMNDHGLLLAAAGAVVPEPSGRQVYGPALSGAEGSSSQVFSASGTSVYARPPVFVGK